VALRVIPERLGHKSPRITARSTPLTPQTFDGGQATLTALLAARAPRRRTGMPAVAAVWRRDGPDDRERYGADLLPSHRRAMEALIRCRTEALGGQLWPCERGAQVPDVYHACRHRRCPTCHHQDPAAWRQERRQELLLGPSCRVVLSLPPERREVVRRHPTDLDDLVRRAAAHAMLQLAADPYDVGGWLGTLGVLPTWTRALVSHPPVHCLVPAGGLSAERSEGRAARQTSRVPVPALAQLFRGVFLALVHQERPDLTRPEAVWPTRGVVDGQPPGPGPEKGLNDLGREVHRIALTPRRLRSIEDGHVGFPSRDSQAQRWKPMTLPAQECIRRCLPPVVPQGFPTVRADGLWRPLPRPGLPPRQRWLARHAPDPLPPPLHHRARRPIPGGPPRRAGQPWPHGGQGLLVLIRLLPRHPRGPP
jgi:Putative transposase/Transposase zinc-binding domain